MEPRLTAGQVRELVANALGSEPRDGVTIESQALAEASVAVVIPFTWHDQQKRPHRGVLKVLKPGIEETLEEDLSILARLGDFLDERCHEYQIPPIDYAEVFARIPALLRREVRLSQEQQHLREARSRLEGLPFVRVPQPLDLSTCRVTAMERIDGDKVTDACQLLPSPMRRLVARQIIEALIAQPIWSESPHATFHADPHAGNLFWTRDNRLAILDWSLVGQLSQTARQRISQILLAAMLLDERGVQRQAARLSDGPVSAASLAPVVQDAMRRLRQGQLPGIRWLTTLLDAAASSGSVRFSSDLMMFRKSLLTLEGVLGDIDGQCDVDAVLTCSLLKRLQSESFRRLVTHPCSRQYGSHLSNFDLARIVLAGPWVASRYWLELWADVGRPAGA
jgi:ubiquinone biosynthesis protein